MLQARGRPRRRAWSPGRYGDGAPRRTCDLASPEQWFTGVGRLRRALLGAGAHQPRPGPGGRRRHRARSRRPRRRPGQVRGVAVPGGAHSSASTSAQVVPEPGRPQPAGRGRPAAASAPTWSTRSTSWAAAPRSRDWLPAQAAPATTSHLACGARRQARRPGAGGRQPGRRRGPRGARGGDQGERVRPSGLKELTVPPGGTTSVDLTRVLRSRAARGAHRPARLDASLPVTAACAPRPPATSRTPSAAPLRSTTGRP